jgi:FixJ family two-component response regulator
MRGSGQVQSPFVAVVDDDASIRRATQILLRAAGFATAGYASAEAFLDSPVGPGASCLVADLHLPGLSGLELHARQWAEGLKIPTLLVTGDTAWASQARAGRLPEGVLVILDKPFEGDTLVQWVRAALGDG